MKGGFDVTLKGWRLLAILVLWLGSLVGLLEFVFMIVEEIGELARLVLIDDGAHGTTYRAATRDDLLEESADVLICTFALLEKLELSDDDLEPWIRRKMRKWIRALEGKLLPK